MSLSIAAKRALFRPEYNGIRLFNADSSAYSHAREAGTESLYFSGSKVLT
jgi:hypothetical protein